MMLSEIKGERALDILADLLSPVGEILSDKNVVGLIQSGNRIGTIQAVLKNHKKSIITILALLEEKEPETYKPSLVEIPVKLLILFNDPALRPFFVSQGHKTEETSFGSATVNTGATETE